MRDLLFKNLTSADKKRRVIASSEIMHRDGVRNVIRRHFICIVREINQPAQERLLPCLSVLKEKNTKARRERFFCKVKNSVYAVYKGKLFLITFMHTLNITLTAETLNSNA